MTSLRYALRTLGRTPMVSLLVVLSLALGIGANTAIFSVFRQALLKQLPVRNPEELVLLSAPGDMKGGRNSTDNAGGTEMIFSYPMLRELEKAPNGLTGVAGYRPFSANLAFEGNTQSGSVNAVSGGYFPLLGTRPAIGRLLDESDDRGKGQPVAVLSHKYWRDRLGGRDEVLNKPIRVNAQVFTIVGVAQERFDGIALGSEQDVFVPLAFKPALTPGWDGTTSWNDYYLYCFGRLAPGATLARAQNELNGVYAGLAEKQAAEHMPNRGEGYRERFRKHRLTLLPGELGHSSLREQLRTPLTILLICTALVLLIASANAANLLLARAVQRTRDLSIRTALGASRWRIVGQLMTEAMLLAIAGGVAGLVVGMWALDALVTATSDSGSGRQLFDTRLDGAVLAFGFGLALCTGLLFGMYPAWSAARASVSGTLKEDSGQASASRAGVRMRRALVTVQVAFSLLLLIPMGLFLKSLVNLLKTDLGMKTGNVITFILSPELNGYSFDRARQFFTDAEEQLAAIPGIERVTASLVPLISGSNWGNNINVDGFSAGPDSDDHSMFNMTGPEFFSRMGVPLVAGREFTDADTASSPKVAVVNETWARHFAPDRSPIGLRFGLGSSGDRETTIVGVVQDSKYAGVRQETPRVYFVPYRQQDQVGRLSFYVHTALPMDQTNTQIRRVMTALDPDLPLEGMQTFEARIRDNIQGDRITLQLASAFALLATVLSMLGLYGVVAFGVARRTREIGIRMALGAGAASIRGLVFTEVAIILIIGAVFGVPGALALARFAQSQLYGVQSNDPIVVTSAIAALIAAAALAAWLPARRAARINPIQALRYE